MHRDTIMITGATGNVGRPLLHHLLQSGSSQHRIIAGIRNPLRDREALPAPDIEIVGFDFADAATYRVLREVDRLFLLRPPQLADVSKYFTPLIEAAGRAEIKHIVFLSVQGAEKQSWIPHHKIEQLIRDSGIAYTFLRPSYFMQNFTTTLREDIREHNRIYLPAGAAKFNLVDTRDIARVASEVLMQPAAYQGEAIELTGPENLTFGEMAEILSEELERPIAYESPNPFSFVLNKWKEGTGWSKALVMTALHYLPRFGAPPEKHEAIWRKLGVSPRSFRQFVREHRELWA